MKNIGARQDEMLKCYFKKYLGAGGKICSGKCCTAPLKLGKRPIYPLPPQHSCKSRVTKDLDMNYEESRKNWLYLLYCIESPELTLNRNIKMSINNFIFGIKK